MLSPKPYNPEHYTLTPGAGNASDVRGETVRGDLTGYDLELRGGDTEGALAMTRR